MALDKLKNLFGTDEGVTEDIREEVYYEKTRPEVTNELGAAGAKMMLLEPRAYSESQQIADYLKGRNSVVVNLKRVTPDQAKRIVDFLSGTLYAIGGDLQKLGGGIFLCTPNNVDVEGKISEEAANQKNTKVSKEKQDDFDW